MIRTYSCCFVNNPLSVFVVHIYNILIFNSESEGYPDHEEIWNFLNGNRRFLEAASDPSGRSASFTVTLNVEYKIEEACTCYIDYKFVLTNDSYANLSISRTFFIP